VTGYLLDTNVLSAVEPGRAGRSPEFAPWLETRSDRLYLSVISVIEIESGIRNLRRRGSTARASALDQWLAETVRSYGDRVLALDIAIARAAGAIVDRVKAAGQRPELADIVIAATAQVHQLLVLTANTKHFAATGVRHVNPYEVLPE
jgi:toxin FitB